MNTFKWCNYNWKGEMDGGRIIHPEYPWYWYSNSENVVVRMRNGEIHFYCKRNPKEVKHWDGKVYHPTYEVPTMRSVQSFSHGIFSCEMLMPEGKNISASFWLSGEGNWPPEIDIEEGWTEEENSWYRTRVKYFPWFQKSWRTTTNVHYRTKSLVKSHTGSRNISIKLQPLEPNYNFVEYKCIWTSDSIKFYANGVEVRRVSKSIVKKMEGNLTNKDKGFKMNVIFNVWIENPDEHTIEMEQPMKIRNFKYVPL